MSLEELPKLKGRKHFLRISPEMDILPVPGLEKDTIKKQNRHILPLGL